ncbi:MAG: hypothetical protein GY715_01225 [Planctomycetes bacterium]|nr:hypothetical protein [Planctomycetota bacterium]
MVLRPEGQLADVDTQPQRMPWLERRQRGRFSGWVGTIGMALVKPRALMKAVPPAASSWQAWWFAAITGAVVMLLSMLPTLLFATVLPIFAMRAGAGGGGPGPAALAGIIAGMGVVGLLVGLILTLAYILVWGLVTHGLLMITGPRVGGLDRTLQALCYSSGANIASAFPCFGPYFGWIWWVVSAVLTVMEAQKIRALRASLTVAAFPVILTILLVAGYFALILASASFASSSAMTGQPATVQALRISQALSGSVTADGSYPDHGLMLVVDANMSPGEFISPMSSTTWSDITLGQSDLGEFRRQGSGRQAQMAGAAADALPPDTVAHRIGDVVFTFHGLDPAGDPSLWVFVMPPDPAPFPGGAQVWIVAEAGGSVYPVQQRGFSLKLAEQNDLRAQAGLPPLPDPSTVGHDAPATAP